MNNMKQLFLVSAVAFSLTGCLDTDSDSTSTLDGESYTGKTTPVVLGTPDEVNEILKKTIFAEQGMSSNPADIPDDSSNEVTPSYISKATAETGGSYTGSCGGTREVVLEGDTFINTFADYCWESAGTQIVYNGEYTYQNTDGVETQVFNNFSEVIADYGIDIVLNGESVWTPTDDFEGTSLGNLTTTDRANNVQYSLVDFETIAIEYVDANYETFDSKGRMFQSELGALDVETIEPRKFLLGIDSDAVAPVEGKLRLKGDRSYILEFNVSGYKLGEEDGTTGNFKADASQTYSFED